MVRNLKGHFAEYRCARFPPEWRIGKGKQMAWKTYYGSQYRKSAPDFSKCSESVSDRDGWGSHQCTRKATQDPDEQGRPTKCKQHSSAKVRDRQAKSEAKWKSEMTEWKLRWAAPKMKAALQQIADGHNDPRSLAADLLKSISEE